MTSPASTPTPAADRPLPRGVLVIAHRGASGYLPEHTLAAKAMAHAQGADYLEQDVVLTSDDVPIVLHDIHLDTTTDVATRFPDRARADGRYYALDFTLAEIRTLRAHERVDHATGQPVFAQRFPTDGPILRVPTLDEELQLARGLAKSTGREAGVYAEIKAPAWHRQQGHDISPIVLAVLARHGYHGPDDKAFLQCFDAAELRRIREELGSRLRHVQLIADNAWGESATDYDHLRTAAGLAEVAEYAEGIGPWIPHVVTGLTPSGAPQTTPLVAAAHRAGLVVHPYTLRADQLPPWAQTFEQLVGALVAAGVDGLFTDFPDRTRAALAHR